jgi:hypothetical protein
VYRAAVVEEGGIRRLVAAMRTFPDRANLILHACSCLLNLALANGTLLGKVSAEEWSFLD